MVWDVRVRIPPMSPCSSIRVKTDIIVVALLDPLQHKGLPLPAERPRVRSWRRRCGGRRLRRGRWGGRRCCSWRSSGRGSRELGHARGLQRRGVVLSRRLGFGGRLCSLVGCPSVGVNGIDGPLGSFDVRGVGAMAGKGVGTGVGSTLPSGETRSPSSAFTSFIGMANPIPITGRPEPSSSTRETTTPIACPNMSSRGPPLLPGLTEASVCRRPSRLADMIPRLTVGSDPRVEPRGNPIAMTSAPTRTSSESPTAMGVKVCVESIAMYARSRVGWRLVTVPW